MIHGLLCFFKHVFADLSFTEEEKKDSFVEWRQLYHKLLEMCLEINKICAILLSNNRLTSEGEELVDCRGHPISSESDNTDKTFEDYENLVLVGIWLAVKENGEFMQNLIEWSELPEGPEDDSKFLLDSDVKGLCKSFLEMLF